MKKPNYFYRDSYAGLCTVCHMRLTQLPHIIFFNVANLLLEMQSKKKS